MEEEGKKGKNKRVGDNIPPNLPSEFKKKKKNGRVGDGNPPKLPDEFKKVIMGSFKAHGEEIKDEVLVIEKLLTASDVDPIQGRFSIPLKSIQTKFLTEAEENLLKTPKENGEELNDIPVDIVEPICKIHLVILKRQVMKDKKNKDSSKESVSYMFKTHWNDLVKSSKLREGQLVQLWAMRVGLQEELWFALVRLPDGGMTNDDSNKDPLPSDSIKV